MLPSDFQGSIVGETASVDGSWLFDFDITYLPAIKPDIMSLPPLDDLPFVESDSISDWLSEAACLSAHEGTGDHESGECKQDPLLISSDSSNSCGDGSLHDLPQDGLLLDVPQTNSHSLPDEAEATFCSAPRPCGGEQKLAEVNLQDDPSHKKKMRLLRNRELAFESRQRKISYINDLELKCKMLEKERNQLHQQICLSCTENALLKEEISRLKKMKGNTGVAEPAVLVKGSLPLEFLSHHICLSLVAWVLLLVNLFISLLMMALLQSFNPTTGGLAKGQGDDGRGYTFPSRTHAMLNMWSEWQSYISSRNQRAFSFWKRRCKYGLVRSCCA